MTDQLLSFLSLYGVAALLVILVIACIGVPFPITLLLIATGSFVAQGDMKLWEVLVFGIIGAVTGDQIGYAIGRWGGQELVQRIVHRFGGAASIKRAEVFGDKWGGAAVFFTRWLVTPLGPWINLLEGVSAYSWPRFLIWDALGNTVWVVLYVMLGKIFSDRVQALADILGNLTWVMAGAIVTALLGWKLFHSFHNAEEAPVADSGKPQAGRAMAGD